MKRLLVFALITVFSISLMGCVAKTEYDKTLQEKARIEKVCENLKEKGASFKSEIAEKQEEIKTLRVEIRQATSELSEAKSKINELNKQLSALSREEE